MSTPAKKRAGLERTASLPAIVEPAERRPSFQVDVVGLGAELDRRKKQLEESDPKTAEDRFLIEMIRLGAALIGQQGIHWEGFLSLERHAAKLEDDLAGRHRDLSVTYGAPRVAIILAVDAFRKANPKLSIAQARRDVVAKLIERTPKGLTLGSLFPARPGKRVAAGDQVAWQEHPERIAERLEKEKAIIERSPDAWGPGTRRLFERLKMMMEKDDDPLRAFNHLFDFAILQLQLARSAM